LLGPLSPTPTTTRHAPHDIYDCTRNIQLWQPGARRTARWPVSASIPKARSVGAGGSLESAGAPSGARDLSVARCGCCPPTIVNTLPTVPIPCSCPGGLVGRLLSSCGVSPWDAPVYPSCTGPHGGSAQHEDPRAEHCAPDRVPGKAYPTCRSINPT